MATDPSHQCQRQSRTRPATSRQTDRPCLHSPSQTVAAGAGCLARASHPTARPARTCADERNGALVQAIVLSPRAVCHKRSGLVTCVPVSTTVTAGGSDAVLRTANQRRVRDRQLHNRHAEAVLGHVAPLGVEAHECVAPRARERTNRYRCWLTFQSHSKPLRAACSGAEHPMSRW